MQLAIVEFARHVVGLPEAHSIELMPDTPDPVIHLMADQKGVLDIGGTLRPGSYPRPRRRSPRPGFPRL